VGGRLVSRGSEKRTRRAAFSSGSASHTARHPQARFSFRRCRVIVGRWNQLPAAARFIALSVRGDSAQVKDSTMLIPLPDQARKLRVVVRQRSASEQSTRWTLTDAGGLPWPEWKGPLERNARNRTRNRAGFGSVERRGRDSNPRSAEDG
jgi:hypothetical protein